VIGLSRHEIFGSNAFQRPAHRLVREHGEVSEDQHRRDAFETHRHRIFALATYMTGDERVGEELLAETFIQVLKVNPSPDSSAVDLAFVAALRRTMPIGDCTLTLCDVSMHAAPLHRNVLRTELESALLDLPATERLIYLLRDVEGYAPERIATLLSLTEPEVKLALMTGRLKLRELLSEGTQAQSAA
jgi:RNA polymerase sigma-70 factor (ECF subfamily)